MGSASPVSGGFLGGAALWGNVPELCGEEAQEAVQGPGAICESGEQWDKRSSPRAALHSRSAAPGAGSHLRRLPAMPNCHQSCLTRIITSTWGHAQPQAAGILGCSAGMQELALPSQPRCPDPLSLQWGQLQPQEGLCFAWGLPCPPTCTPTALGAEGTRDKAEQLMGGAGSGWL